MADSRPLVLLAGPPNSGKSTLFNSLTGLRQRVANYPGVTVERRSGVVRLASGRVELVDLPGVHGLSSRSLDQLVARRALLGEMEGGRRPDGLVILLDSTRLSSHLMVAESFLGLGIPTLVVLAMADELDRRDGAVEAAELSRELGVEVALVDARDPGTLGSVHSFFEALLTGGEEARACPAVAVADSHVAQSPARAPTRPLPVVDLFSARRDRARQLGRAAGYRAPRESVVTNRLDALALHRIWGPVVFLGVVALVFQTIFAWAMPLMDATEATIRISGRYLHGIMPDGWLRSLLIEGVWAGVGSVIVFLPQILILFFFIALMEDSGYMARAAVVADRLMHRVGLQGRSFLPLLSAYACAIPAIMSARAVEDERDRLATIFIAPFMTCSARLPVYALLIAAFVPAGPVLGPILGRQAAVLIGLYALGLVAAIGTAALLKRTLLRGRPLPFVMELPPYRMPSARSVATRLLDRAKVFLRRAGRIILAVTVVLWVLTQLPRTPDGGSPPIDESALGRMGQLIEPAIEPLGLDWRIGIGLVTSLAAREVIVGTLGTIYGVEAEDDTTLELRAALQRDMDLGSAVALLVFFAFALQCMSTVAVMRRETGGWRWPSLQFAYMLVLAYLGAWAAKSIL
ncbi:MAG: ferrous iron transport protein B [Gemmatimonadetes bacterium]|nr:ferrous iron transport protein B [Gemmatimonadota bacterium]